MEFRVMGEKGHAVMDYDLETAEVKFNELVEANLMPVALDGPGNMMPMTTFDPKVKSIMWMHRLKAG